jgi:diketogulonate reductase-like aldo/keto reductase
LAYCQKQDIQVEAWSPLMRGNYFDDPTLTQLAEKYNKTVAQIILRWDIQQKVVTIPKSVNADRIKENAQIFDFELTEEEMEQIAAMNENLRFGPDPDNFNF